MPFAVISTKPPTRIATSVNLDRIATHDTLWRAHLDRERAFVAGTVVRIDDDVVGARRGRCELETLADAETRHVRTRNAGQSRRLAGTCGARADYGNTRVERRGWGAECHRHRLRAEEEDTEGNIGAGLRETRAGFETAVVVRARADGRAIGGRAD